MRFRWSALVLVLTLGLMPRDGQAQSASSAQKAPAGSMRQNYPNPFNPETRGVFTVGSPPACPDGGKEHRASVRIHNVIGQLVAIPVLQGGSGSVAGGQPLENVKLACGEYTWYWNGNYRNTSKEAASGVYAVVLEIDGRTVGRPIKMTIAK